LTTKGREQEELTDHPRIMKPIRLKRKRISLEGEERSSALLSPDPDKDTRKRKQGKKEAGQKGKRAKRRKSEKKTISSTPGHTRNQIFGATTRSSPKSASNRSFYVFTTK
jgi:hypothetical protein